MLVVTDLGMRVQVAAEFDELGLMRGQEPFQVRDQIVTFRFRPCPPSPGMTETVLSKFMTSASTTPSGPRCAGRTAR